MLHTIIMSLSITTALTASSALTDQPAQENGQQAPVINPAYAFMESLAEADSNIDSMTSDIQYTIIQALESDLQRRIGTLYLNTDHDQDERAYAVRFNILEIDDRQEDIREHYIFDGRWFVERLPDEKQFNKRELVAADQRLDPMELMREAPFWVSLGQNTNRVFDSYRVQLLDHKVGLADNNDFPELKFLIETVVGAQQLLLTPKQGSGFEDDWDWVRIWFDSETKLPMLYVKADFTGDLQIVQLLGVKTNTDLDPSLFDTTTPPPESGWNAQVTRWRGEAQAGPIDTAPIEDALYQEVTP
ncbi:MAG: outer membrane lipoprotein carrier protein LolA [Phycisphaerales bacterium]